MRIMDDPRDQRMAELEAETPSCASGLPSSNINSRFFSSRRKRTVVQGDETMKKGPESSEL
jgi:hypothetical protein